MALFRPYNRDQEQSSPEPAAAGDDAQPRKKGVPTPSRTQAEAARRERLQPTLDKKAEREATRRLNQAERLKHLRALDGTPERVLLRDYVDRRWNVAEFMLPLMILLMAASFMFQGNPTWVNLVAIGAWVVLFVVAGDMYLMWRGFKVLLAERMPKSSPKGLFSYGMNRAIQIRRWRAPGPRVKRGEKI